MRSLRLIAVNVLLLQFLAGCTASFEDVRAQMDAIRQKPRGTVEPPPEFTPIPTFTYAAHQLRSPFAPPISAEQLIVNSGKKVEPDLSRPQEYLERFSLEAMRFRGVMQRPGGPLFALIEDGDGGVQRVKVGSYLGKNHGRIVDVTPNLVSIMEIVPDGRDGWVERPRSLSLSE